MDLYLWNQDYANWATIVNELSGRHNSPSVFYGSPGGAFYLHAIIGSVMVTLTKDYPLPATFLADFPQAIDIGDSAPLRSVAPTSR